MQGVLQGGGSLSSGDVLATGPAADGFGIVYPGYYRDQALAEEFLKVGGSGRDALATFIATRINHGQPT